MKGSRVNQFAVGERVMFKTDVGHKVYDRVEDKNGKKHDVFSHKVSIMGEDFGRIVKLHRSGRQGVAEIRPESPLPGTESRKVSRKLQHVVNA